MKKALSVTLLPVFLYFMAMFASPAIAGDYVIVPGQRIGSVSLGQSLQAVHKKLNAPKMVRQLSGGIVEESWVSHLTLAQQNYYSHKGLYWNMFFVNVYFRRGQVTQIEVNSPQFHTVNGLSTSSPASKFEQTYRPYRSSDKKWPPIRYGSRDPGGYPGTKHYIVIGDAVQMGLAWRYGCWGSAGPEPDPNWQEVVIVHRSGQPAIREPDASNRFVPTEPAQAVDWRLHPIASQACCVQFIGRGPRWRKNTGLSDSPDDNSVGIQISDRKMIAAFFSTIHCSGRMVRFPPNGWSVHYSVDYIGVFLSYTPPRPNPAGEGLTDLAESFYMTYLRSGGSAFLLDSTNKFGQTIPPVFAARFEAMVKHITRMARRHRGRAKFFHYDQAELAAS